MSREQAPNPELQAKADSLEDTASRAEVALALGRLGARVRKNKKPKSDRKPKSSTSASSSVVGDDLDDEDEIIVEESRSGKELQSAQDDFDFDSFGNTADHKGPVRNSQTVSDHFFHPEQYESFHDIESADATAGDRSHLVDLDSKSEETEGHIVVESRDGRGRGGSVLATHLVESGDETDDDMKSARGATCWGCCCRWFDEAQSSSIKSFLVRSLKKKDHLGCKMVHSFLILALIAGGCYCYKKHIQRK